MNYGLKWKRYERNQIWLALNIADKIRKSNTPTDEINQENRMKFYNKWDVKFK